LGEPGKTIIQAATSKAPALRVTANNVIIEGFSITGSYSFVTSSGRPGSAAYIRLGGITLDSCKCCDIQNNTCFNNSYGIFLWFAHYNLIQENTVYNNTESGVGIYHSNNNTIYRNLSLKNRNGVEMESGYENLVIENLICENRGVAVCLSSSESTDPNLSKNNTILRNEISGNNVAIELYVSVENTITENNVSYNNYTFSLSYAGDDLIYHNNFINNTAKVCFVYDPHGTVRLDNGQEGNYWSDCSSECYVVDGQNKDNHPLKSPYT
jgi:parallel beta-helix repeat protein